MASRRSVLGACAAVCLWGSLWACADVPASSDAASADPPPTIQAARLPSPHTLAILPFDNRHDDPRYAWLEHGLPDMLTTDLAGQGMLSIVSRRRIGELLREQWLQQRGMSSHADAVRLGQLIGARYLLSGSFFPWEDQLLVDAHVLDVERGTVVRAIRVSGAVHAIPELERDLARQVRRLFGPPASSPTRSIRSDDTAPVVGWPDAETPESSTSHQHAPPPIPQTRVWGHGLSLRLEREHYLKGEAQSVAERVWREGMVTQLGPVVFSDVCCIGQTRTVGVPIVSILVSSYVSDDRIQQLHPAIRVDEETDAHTGRRHRVLSWDAQGTAADRVFRQRFQAPRRLFVRALTSEGRVVAVASPWSWRTALSVRPHDNTPVRVPLVPMPFVEGEAHFATEQLHAHAQDLMFDAVWVPIPQERRTVIAEVVEDAESSEHAVDAGTLLADRLRTFVEGWFRQYWTPSINEAMPGLGYLPGNRRTMNLRVVTRGLSLHTVHVIDVPHEPLLAVQLHNLVHAFEAACMQGCPVPDVRAEAVDQPHLEKTAIRVYLEVAKDLTTVQLGQVMTPPFEF